MQRPFKFLNFWVRKESFKQVVEDNWKADFSGDPFIVFHYKLKRVKKALAIWSKASFGDIFRNVVDFEYQVRNKEAQLEIYPTSESKEELNRANAKHRKYYLYEEEF